MSDTIEASSELKFDLSENIYAEYSIRDIEQGWRIDARRADNERLYSQTFVNAKEAAGVRDLLRQNNPLSRDTTLIAVQDRLDMEAGLKQEAARVQEPEGREGPAPERQEVTEEVGQQAGVEQGSQEQGIEAGEGQAPERDAWSGRRELPLVLDPGRAPKIDSYSIRKEADGWHINTERVREDGLVERYEIVHESGASSRAFESQLRMGNREAENKTEEALYQAYKNETDVDLAEVHKANGGRIPFESLPVGRVVDHHEEYSKDKASEMAQGSYTVYQEPRDWLVHGVTPDGEHFEKGFKTAQEAQAYVESINKKYPGMENQTHPEVDKAFQAQLGRERGEVAQERMERGEFDQYTVSPSEKGWTVSAQATYGEAKHYDYSSAREAADKIAEIKQANPEVINQSSKVMEKEFNAALKQEAKAELIQNNERAVFDQYQVYPEGKEWAVEASREDGTKEFTSFPNAAEAERYTERLAQANPEIENVTDRAISEHWRGEALQERNQQLEFSRFELKQGQQGWEVVAQRESAFGPAITETKNFATARGAEEHIHALEKVNPGIENTTSKAAEKEFYTQVGRESAQEKGPDIGPASPLPRETPTLTVAPGDKVQEIRGTLTAGVEVLRKGPDGLERVNISYDRSIDGNLVQETLQDVKVDEKTLEKLKGLEAGDEVVMQVSGPENDHQYAQFAEPQPGQSLHEIRPAAELDRGQSLEVAEDQNRSQGPAQDKDTEFDR